MGAHTRIIWLKGERAERPEEKEATFRRERGVMQSASWPADLWRASNRRMKAADYRFDAAAAGSQGG
ncbi:hypothetical protein ATPR_0532 [Acetobacter tropicalis NBRC 101654]|uniref:Uncharacterized protein n=1 Tax=Acetobacter tropicalis NBRC 101654 TaxID=749388 RepID=F7VAY3_9PROT|nr:hypothetical protein ATPR_0532 [Acetobacter tropicalis NBRC 101654]